MWMLSLQPCLCNMRSTQSCKRVNSRHAVGVRAFSGRLRRRAPILPVVLAALLSACSKDVVQITIPPGSSVRAVSDSLKSAGLVSYPALFRAYAKIGRRDRAVKAGTFLIARGSSWGTILDSLTRGRGMGLTLTIPEGFSLAAIESLMVDRLRLQTDSVAAAARDSVARARMGVTASSLEGYLFPDTYDFQPGVPAAAAMNAMLERFESVWESDSDWNKRLAELSMTRHQIVTLASIIEKEATIEDERPIISAVFHNRLKIGMALQADPTVQYARGQHADRVYLKHLEVESPYNTYKYPGLPPGPIASPGKASLRAALYPAGVKFLYFVAHPDGHHEFRNTYAEHLAAKQNIDRIRKAGTGPRLPR